VRRPVAPKAPPEPERAFSLFGAQIVAEPLAPGLYVVATPIGNLGDITIRALLTLASADAILAEDTRVSRRLLDEYAIKRPLIAYHEHNAREAEPKLLAMLASGRSLALISDAGTPLVSDPGHGLVSAALGDGIPVVPVPGASAVIAALSAAGLPSESFLFSGFLPNKGAARRARLNALAALDATLVFYEAPHRLAECLSDLAAELGPRRAVVARELTKTFEEFRRGTLSELADQFAGEPQPKGEIVILVGPPVLTPRAAPDVVDEEIVRALETLSVKDAAAAVAARHALPRRDVYARALSIKRARGR